LIDSTIVRAHQHSERRKEKDGDQATGRSAGGLSTRIHTFVDALSQPDRICPDRVERPVIWQGPMSFCRQGADEGGH